MQISVEILEVILIHLIFSEIIICQIAIKYLQISCEQHHTNAQFFLNISKKEKENE